MQMYADGYMQMALLIPYVVVKYGLSSMVCRVWSVKYGLSSCNSSDFITAVDENSPWMNQGSNRYPTTITIMI